MEDELDFQVVRVGTGFSQPLFATMPDDGTNRTFILEQGGVIKILDAETGMVNVTPFLDISDEVSVGAEQGLLGLAFAPDFATSGTFYINMTNDEGDTEIRRYNVSAEDADQADESTADIILEIAQPEDNHNAGWLDFGPDGFLYIPTGDGGGFVNLPAQNNNSLLGKILRIDPSGDDFPGDENRDYAIPEDNPFVGEGGADEIIASGLRNPSRASFDRLTGDLYLGDVGEQDREEINILPQNAIDEALNFGWDEFEGTLPFMSGEDDIDDTDFIRPVLEYDSNPMTGFAVTGGYVYRGPAPSLQGEYIFGDFVTANIWSIPASELTENINNKGEPSSTLTEADATLRNTDFTPDEGTIDLISSFGEDVDGNLYIVDYDDGEIFMVQSTVVAPPPNTLQGDAEDNKLKGTDADETLLGLGGDDKLDGRGGDDIIDGGSGDDKIKDRDGANTIDGQGGDDRISTGDGNDTISGGGGDDRVKDKGGVNTVMGGDGDDRIQMKDGTNMIMGGAGDDDVRVKGGTNMINGGAGTDELRAGKEDDTFVFEMGNEVDILSKFNKKGADVVDLTAFAGLDFAMLQMQMQEDGKDLVWDAGGGDQLVFEKTDMEDLTADNFMFA